MRGREVWSSEGETSAGVRGEVWSLGEGWSVVWSAGERKSGVRAEEGLTLGRQEVWSSGGRSVVRGGGLVFGGGGLVFQDGSSRVCNRRIQMLLNFDL